MVSVLFGRGDGTFESGPELATLGARNVATGDFNADGWPDIALTISRTYPLPGSFSVFLGTGGGSLMAGRTIGGRSGYSIVLRISIATADSTSWRVRGFSMTPAHPYG